MVSCLSWFPLTLLTGTVFGFEPFTVVILLSRCAATVAISFYPSIVELPITSANKMRDVLDLQLFRRVMVIVHANSIMSYGFHSGGVSRPFPAVLTAAARSTVFIEAQDVV